MFRANLINELVRYTDSNWIRLKNIKRSISKYTCIFSDGLVSYQSKHQAIIALFSIKVEYMAITKAGKKAL